MNRKPYIAPTSTVFDKAFHLAKRHAEKFGWHATNEDIRAAAGTAQTVSLNTLITSQLREVIAVWEKNLAGDGHPPVMPYENFKRALDTYRDRFGREAMQAKLRALTGTFYATNVRHHERERVANEMLREIDADIERARGVARGDKPDRRKNVPTRHPHDGGYVTINTVVQDNPLLANTEQALRMADLIHGNKTGFKFDTKTGRLKCRSYGRASFRGPITADIMSERTRDLEEVTLRFGSRVRLNDGKRGRVTSLRDITWLRPDKAVCGRLVVLMDDLTTRVLQHGDAISFYVTDVEGAR